MSKRSLRLPLLITAAWLAACIQESPVLPPVGTDQQSQAVPIPGQYIVVFRDQVVDPAALRRDLEEAQGFEVGHTYSSTIRGFSAVLSNDDVARLSSHPMIESVVQDAYLYINNPVTDSPPVALSTTIEGRRASNLVATAVSSSQIDLSWNGTAPTAQYFLVRRRVGQSGAFSTIREVPASTTTFSDPGRTAGTQYCYQVSEWPGAANPSNIACSTPGSSPTPPAAPSNTTATAASTSQINVSWADNSSDEQTFDVYRRLGTTGSFALVAQVSADVTTYSDPGLPAATQFCYNVQASNANGSSAPSNTSCATTSTPPPGAPVLVATAVSSSQVDLTWSGTSATARYVVIRRRIGQSGSFSSIGEVVATTTSFTNTGLTAGTQYCYQITQWPAPSNPSNIACATPGGTPVPPAAPSNATATATSSSHIGVSWTDNSANEQSFDVYRRLGQTGSFTLVAQLGANVTTFNDPGLLASTQYCYEVRASNAAGSSGPSNTSCATTLALAPPAAPSNTTATAASTSQINVSWADNSSDEQTFDVYRRLGTTGSFALVAQVSADVTTYSDPGLPAATQFCYNVQASNANGSSAPSNTSCATTSTPPPGAPVLVATAVSSSQVDLTWSGTSATARYVVIRRRIGQSGSFSSIGEVVATTTSFANTGLTAGTQYCYQITQWPAPSNPSNIACATPQPPPPGVCTDTGNHDGLSQLWNISRIQANLNPTWQATQQTGCEITVDFYGLDTGVDSDHPDLNVVEIMNFVAAEPARTGEDGNGHGTHTAGTAAARDGNGGVVGVAPGAPVHGFRVCNDSGQCPISDIIAGIDMVTARKLATPSQPIVANMSLGGSVNGPLDQAVRRSMNSGVVYAVSAGNGAFGSCSVPADAQNASPARVGDDDVTPADGSNGDFRPINGIITTTSSNQLDQDANCNYGDPVTIAAPGVGILSTYLAGGYAALSGTSMASPHSAGAAMLYLQSNPNATPTQVEQWLVSQLDPWTTDDLPNASGRLNARLP